MSIPSFFLQEPDVCRSAEGDIPAFFQPAVLLNAEDGNHVAFRIAYIQEDTVLADRHTAGIAAAGGYTLDQMGNTLCIQ